MHDLAVAEGVIKIIETEARKNGISNVAVAKLRIGKMAALQMDYLTLQNIKFEIDEIPVEIECQSCGEHFIDKRFDDADFAHSVAHAPLLYIYPLCPNCSKKNGIIITGKEMELVFIEGK